MCLHTHIVNSLNFQSGDNHHEKLSKQHKQNHKLLIKYSQFCPLSHITSAPLIHRGIFSQKCALSPVLSFEAVLFFPGIMSVTQNNTVRVGEEKRLQSAVLCISAFVQRPALRQTKGVELWLRSSRVYCKNIKKKWPFL